VLKDTRCVVLSEFVSTRAKIVRLIDQLIDYKRRATSLFVIRSLEKAANTG